MNSIFIEIIENYKIIKDNLIILEGQFFENWCRIHIELFKKLSEENFENFDEINKNFMKKRSRMASAFMQGLKTKDNNVNQIKKFKALLKEHDEVFKKLLNDVLIYYSDELIKVQRYRKVTAAYDYAHGG